MNRITSSTMARHVLADLNAGNARLSRIQDQLSSGKALLKPSDDPAAVGRALQYRKDIEETQQFQKNASEAKGWTDVTDSALATVNDALQRVRELTVTASTATTGPEALEAISKEIEGLIDAVKIAGNANYGGRYVFAGTKSDTPPYTVGGADDYQGDDNPIRRSIGPGVTVDVGSTGRSVLGDENGGLLQSLRTVLGHVQAGNAAALTADLSMLDADLDTLNAARATVGATANRLEVASARLAEYEGTALTLLNETESVDLGKAMIEFTIQQNAMQAGLKAGASIVQNSLLDFLR